MRLYIQNAVETMFEFPLMTNNLHGFVRFFVIFVTNFKPFLKRLKAGVAVKILVKRCRKVRREKFKSKINEIECF